MKKIHIIFSIYLHNLLLKISNKNLGVTIPKPLYFEKTSKISQQHHKALENIATLVGLSVFF